MESYLTGMKVLLKLEEREEKILKLKPVRLLSLLKILIIIKIFCIIKCMKKGIENTIPMILLVK